MSAWTESPADVSLPGGYAQHASSLEIRLNVACGFQKLDRLKNGKRKAKADAEEEEAVHRKKMRDREIRSTIDQHNVSVPHVTHGSEETSRVD